jgi:methyltransferase (TIGR00027 family)
MSRRIDSSVSKTAKIVCFSRAVSAMETRKYYKSGDYIAPRMLPRFCWPFVHLSLGRKFYHRIMAPPGIYEYIIARTKYIDEIFEKALAEGFDQILIMGAGFDSRAWRFQGKMGKTRLFELDIPTTQQVKIYRWPQKGLQMPANLTFIAIDFDKESLPDKLIESGFHKGERSLFLLEGLLMYLQPESVDATFKVIQEFAGSGSLIVFDYIYASVLRREGLFYGESSIIKNVSDADEHWHFGIEKDEIEKFLAKYNLLLIDHKDSKDLEKTYFSNAAGKIVGRVNGTHCIVTAKKS